MMSHQWMVEVLADLELYAEANDLTPVLPHLRAAQRAVKGNDADESGGRYVIPLKDRKSG